VNHGQTWKGWERSGEKGLIISDNQAQTWLIITINDTSIGDLPLIITISDTCKNQPKRLDFDNTINLSSLIVSLVVPTPIATTTSSKYDHSELTPGHTPSHPQTKHKKSPKKNQESPLVCDREWFDPTRLISPYTENSYTTRKPLDVKTNLKSS
jgi:hypothetical protein